MVQEKNGPLKGRGAGRANARVAKLISCMLTVQTHRCGPAGVWKMVTGLVDAGEDINDAAEREVLEETGVKAKFAAVLALRQAHGFAFGKSDFFFVVALR